MNINKNKKDNNKCIKTYSILNIGIFKRRSKLKHQLNCFFIGIFVFDMFLLINKGGRKYLKQMYC